MSEDPYRILGVARDATAEAIKRAYRRQARKNHPDVHGNKSPEEQNAYAQQFRRAAWAFEVLSDPDERAYYDANGATRSDQADKPLTEIERSLLDAFERVMCKIDGSRLATVDFIRLVRTHIEDEAAELSRGLCGGRRAAAELEILSGRFARRGVGRNIFEQRVDADKTAVAAKIDDMEERLAHLHACLEELTNWSYRRDVAAASTFGATPFSLPIWGN